MLAKPQFFVNFIYLDKLHLNDVVQTVPSIFFIKAISFNVESVTYKNLKFEVWDLGG